MATGGAYLLPPTINEIHASSGTLATGGIISIPLTTTNQIQASSGTLATGGICSTNTISPLTNPSI